MRVTEMPATGSIGMEEVTGVAEKRISPKAPAGAASRSGSKAATRVTKKKVAKKVAKKTAKKI